MAAAKQAVLEARGSNEEMAFVFATLKLTEPLRRASASIDYGVYERVVYDSFETRPGDPFSQ